MGKTKNIFKCFYCSRETTAIGRQQFTALTVYTFTMVVGMGATFMGLMGPQGFYPNLLNSVYVLSAIFMYIAYTCKKANINISFGVIISLTQLFTSLEMILSALYPSDYGLKLIIADVVILAVNILFSLIAYLKYVPPILAASSIIVIWVCVFITGDSSLQNFATLFTLIFVNTAFLGYKMLINLKTIKAENDDLKEEEKEILSVLKLKPTGVKAFVALAKHKRDNNETSHYLDIMDTVSKQNLIDNVKEFLVRQDAEMIVAKNLFPELSPSELEICKLIVEGKKQSDICITLKKKESNITAQRTNIRRKLGLKPTEDLKEALLQRIAREK